MSTLKKKSERRSFKIGEELTLTIQGLGSHGEGLGRVGEEEIFVPKAAPQDQLRVKILEEKKGRWRADIVEILQSSPQRETPKCKHFVTCGGCDFQHLSYEEQLAWKIRMTKHWIRRSPLEPHLTKIQFDSIAAPQPFGYRHRIRMQVAEGKLHYFLPHSHKMFAVEECPILEDGFFKLLGVEAAQIQNAKDWSQSFSENRLVDLRNPGRYDVAGLKLEYDAQCFTQGNLSMNELLVERVLTDRNLLSNPGASSALDLFCGIGNFSLPLAKNLRSVVGVEDFEASLHWARKNSESLSIKNVEWIHAKSEAALQNLRKQRRCFDWVILDPPRTGALEVARELNSLLPSRITYVSCSLETLIRDLTALCKKGPYRISRWTVVDLFPQTHHIESVVSLQL